MQTTPLPPNAPAWDTFDLKTPSAAGKQSLAEVASEFEGVLIGLLLKSARGESTGWMGTGDDQSLSGMVDVAEQHVARLLARQGGLGLSKLIVQGLEQQQAKQPTTAPVSPAG